MPYKGCQNVFVDVLGKDGWYKVPDSCPECGTTLRESGKLVTVFFPVVYYKPSWNIFLRSRQRQRDEQMERPTYLRNANPGKILHHQLEDHATRSMIRMSSVNVAVWSLLSTFLSTGQTLPSPAIVPLDPWALSCVS
ncbi:hypothetical protein C364_06992 [Cryptococcus neoformans Bt63]|nr:hypothetical protein C364_06992 [Cryptococcus neoformans var. grubii Bt63]